MKVKFTRKEKLSAAGLFILAFILVLTPPEYPATGKNYSPAMLQNYINYTHVITFLLLLILAFALRNELLKEKRRKVIDR